jgi:peptide chain release factor 1
VDPRFLELLEDLEVEYAEVTEKLGDPDVGNDPDKLADLGRRHARISGVLDLWQRHQQAAIDRSEALELADADPDLAEELEAMAADRAAEVERLESELRLALAPRDENDDRDVLIEIRAAAGGDEAAIWAGDLVRMFARFAEREGFKTELLDVSESDAGGYSKVTISVKGTGAFSKFKFESGVHRVQRVPKTESQGRIHTSTATAAVLPEVESVEVDLDPNDVRVDVFRSSGPGGQSVNTTDSAVRLTHEPTGLVVTCQDEKSQLQNKEKAFRILRARLYQAEMERRHAELAGARRSMVGSGDRSEKIRTYNYKENRVTDHRIELTVYKLDAILDGDLDLLVTPLTEAEMTRALDEA